MKRLLLCLCMFLSSCSIMDIDSLTGRFISVSSWEDSTVSFQTMTGGSYTLSDEKWYNINVQNIDGDTYLTHIVTESGVSIMTNMPKNGEIDVRVVKLGINDAGDDFTYELHAAQIVNGYTNTEVSALFINRNLSMMVKNGNVVDVYRNYGYNISDHSHIRSNAIFVSDLFAGYSLVDQVKSWTDSDGLTYVSAIADYTKLVVGKFNKYGAWSIQSVNDLGYNITEFDIKMGSEYPYAIWLKNNNLQLSIYNYTSTTSNPWATIQTLSSVKYPQLSVDTDSYSENVYVGTTHNTRGEFQLYKLDAYKQLLRTGEYITGDNSCYNIAGSSSLGQVLFARSTHSTGVVNATILSTRAYWKELPYTDFRYTLNNLRVGFVSDIPLMIYQDVSSSVRYTRIKIGI